MFFLRSLFFLLLLVFPSSSSFLLSSSSVCTPSSRDDCNLRGTCSSSGDQCECDDPLHFWTSDFCSIQHPGPELEAGQCCYPGATDAYCSYMGSCHSSGAYCECQSSHFWASERCADWHSDPDPDTQPSSCPDPPVFPPTSSPTEAELTSSPTVRSTSMPTTATSTCVPGSRAFCHDLGTCSAAGDGCECDDTLHYWPSERCSTSHIGPELEEGQCCVPGGTDAYCSHMGTCHSSGLYCECDSVNNWASERCSTWHAEPDPEPLSSACPGLPSFPPTSVPTTSPSATHVPTVEPTVPSTLAPTILPPPCVPGTREYCNFAGTCAATGDTCVCDDMLHYWPSQQCSTHHIGPELEAGQCCKPGAVDGYCSYTGTCHSTGLYCLCNSPHFWSSERCATWHEEEDPFPDTCPVPTASPTSPPSNAPTSMPSGEPSSAPSGLPSSAPSGAPSQQPSGTPSSHPSGLPSTEPSSLPSSTPTAVPTRVPTSSPTARPTSCVAGDRGYCSNKGHCSAGSTGCECDDSLHYWPSEQCSTFHAGPELEPGQYCTPHTRNYYCSWVGVCDADGTQCLCDDPEHRSSADRCETWSPLPGGGGGAGLCELGDRAACNNRGTCDSSSGTNVCTCDDMLHYWPSEFCETLHYGAELQGNDCCVAGERDYYCSWMGECDASGDFCICDDSPHRWASERCQHWNTEDDPNPASLSGTDSCPSLLFDETTTPSSSGSEGGMSSVTWMWIIIVIVVGVAVMALLVGKKVMSHDDRNSQFSRDDRSAASSVTTAAATNGGARAKMVNALKRGSSLMRSCNFDYEDVGNDDGDGNGVFSQESPYLIAQREEEEALSKPSNFSYDDMTTTSSMFEMTSPIEEAKEEEELELSKPSNFSYDDVVRNPSMFSTDNDLLAPTSEELSSVAISDDKFGLTNSEMNI